MADGSVMLLNQAGRLKGGDRWRGRHTSLEHADPFAREFFRILNFERVSMHECARRSGLNVATLQNWKAKHAPNIANLEAALNSLGYGLKIIRVGEA